jgi:hypothetical protein
MQDFGYKNEEKRKNRIFLIKKMMMSLATLFSISCFIYITISAYYYIYEDNDSDIEIIKSPQREIKISADQELAINSENINLSSSIYEDILGSKRKSVNQENNKIKIIKSPAPASPPRNFEILQKNQATEKTEENIDKKINLSPKNDDYEERNNDKEIKILESKKRIVKVQIAAISSKEMAQKYLDFVKKQISQPSLKYYLQEINLSKKRVLYRLQIGDFFDQIAAEDFCKKYLVKIGKTKSECIVID